MKPLEDLINIKESEGGYHEDQFYTATDMVVEKVRDCPLGKKGSDRGSSLSKVSSALINHGSRVDNCIDFDHSSSSREEDAASNNSSSCSDEEEKVNTFGPQHLSRATSRSSPLEKRQKNNVEQSTCPLETERSDLEKENNVKIETDVPKLSLPREKKETKEDGDEQKVSNAILSEDLLSLSLPISEVKYVRDASIPQAMYEITGNTTESVPNEEIPWTTEQHRDFVSAVFEIGLKHCSPSVIMDAMKTLPASMSREKTKSHLQKFRKTSDKSLAEFMGEYDAFFDLIEAQQLSLQQRQKKVDRKVLDSNRKRVEDKRSNLTKMPSARDEAESTEENNLEDSETDEPSPPELLKGALGGTDPDELLGGTAAGFTAYSVANNCPARISSDATPFEAAPALFPILSESEKNTSLGESISQVKGALEFVREFILNKRHGVPMKLDKFPPFLRSDDGSPLIPLHQLAGATHPHRPDHNKSSSMNKGSVHNCSSRSPFSPCFPRSHPPGGASGTPLYQPFGDIPYQPHASTSYGLPHANSLHYPGYYQQYAQTYLGQPPQSSVHHGAQPAGSPVRQPFPYHHQQYPVSNPQASPYPPPFPYPVPHQSSNGEYHGGYYPHPSPGQHYSAYNEYGSNHSSQYPAPQPSHMNPPPTPTKSAGGVVSPHNSKYHSDRLPDHCSHEDQGDNIGEENSPGKRRMRKSKLEKRWKRQKGLLSPSAHDESEYRHQSKSRSSLEGRHFLNGIDHGDDHPIHLYTQISSSVSSDQEHHPLLTKMRRKMSSESPTKLGLREHSRRMRAQERARQECDPGERERPNSALSMKIGDFGIPGDELTVDGRNGGTSPTNQVLRDILWEPLSIDSTDSVDLPNSHRHRRRHRDYHTRWKDNKRRGERKSARRSKGEEDSIEPLSYDYEKDHIGNSGRDEIRRRHKYARHAYEHPEYKRDNSSFDEYDSQQLIQMLHTK